MPVRTVAAENGGGEENGCKEDRLVLGLPLDERGPEGWWRRAVCETCLHPENLPANVSVIHFLLVKGDQYTNQLSYSSSCIVLR